MAGCHAKYENRVDKRFSNTWSVNNYKHINDDKKKNIVRNYDQALLSVNECISSMVDIVSNGQGISSLLFASDHGEVVYDDAKQELCGHGSLTLSRSQVDIPAFIWLSDGWKNIYDESGIRENCRKYYFTNNNVFDTLTYIAGISWRGFTESNNFLSKEYSCESVKVITSSLDIVDYNQIICDKDLNVY